ncbi:hypothetical protein LCGC14_1336470 [marine sediment metagenome]|uniref:Uncharacterized protein n=1 Tax=marine sediment metagenome TaxID=412755 RepID=A0A0F9L168_9ZZZZ
MSEKREKSIHVRVSEEFYNAIKKNAKISYSSIVEFCRSAITDKIYKIENPQLPNGDVNALDIRYPIFKKIVKKSMIDSVNNSNLNTNQKVCKVISILNIFDNWSLSQFILPNTFKPDYTKLSKILFNSDLESFNRKVRHKEIREEKVNRNTIILAGDLGLEMVNFYKNNDIKNPIKVADIHNPFSYKIENNDEYFTEKLYFDGFFKDALVLLESNELIELIGEEYKSTNSKTLCKIRDYLKILDFIKKYSLNYLLYQ